MTIASAMLSIAAAIIHKIHAIVENTEQAITTPRFGGGPNPADAKELARMPMIAAQNPPPGYIPAKLTAIALSSPNITIERIRQMKPYIPNPRGKLPGLFPWQSHGSQHLACAGAVGGRNVVTTSTVGIGTASGSLGCTMICLAMLCVLV